MAAVGPHAALPLPNAPSSFRAHVFSTVISTVRPTLTCRATPSDESAGTLPSQQKPQAVPQAWQAAVDLLQSGETFTTSIQSVNKSGVLVAVGKLSGFVPYKLMNRSFLNTLEKESWTRDLVGKEIQVKVTQVVVPERRLICSEKASMLDRAASSIEVGAVVSGHVTSLHSFGAFVEVSEPADLAGTEVILPLREVSWDWISTVNERLTKGQVVTVCVTEVRQPPQSKVVVSLKRMQEDPLKETLDKVLPLENGNAFADVGSVSASVPGGVEDILDELSKESGIGEVTLGRRVEERRTVSQDLELWMSREAVSDGFNLVARAGRVVQEIHVSTGMDADEMRAAVQRVLKRVN